MSTITSTDPRTTPAGPTPSPAFVPFAGGDQRTVFRGVDWHTYTQLSEATGEGQHVRLIYDGKDLEIMVTGHVHEYYKELLSTLVKAVTMGRDLDSVGCGETTWKTVIRGLEADLSYYFEPDKVRVARAALARQSTDPADYPRPDLAIEIVSQNDRADDLMQKVADYLHAGVKAVWLMYPKTGLAYRYSPSKREPEVRCADTGDSFTEPDLLPGFSMLLSEIFA